MDPGFKFRQPYSKAFVLYSTQYLLPSKRITTEFSFWRRCPYKWNTFSAACCSRFTCVNYLAIQSYKVSDPMSEGTAPWRPCSLHTWCCPRDSWPVWWELLSLGDTVSAESSWGHHFQTSLTWLAQPPGSAGQKVFPLLLPLLLLGIFDEHFCPF